jgi:hypothetical protein
MVASSKERTMQLFCVTAFLAIIGLFMILVAL